jgi:hypothetical protein
MKPGAGCREHPFHHDQYSNVPAKYCSSFTRRVSLKGAQKSISTASLCWVHVSQRGSYTPSPKSVMGECPFFHAYSIRGRLPLDAGYRTTNGASRMPRQSHVFSFNGTAHDDFIISIRMPTGIPRRPSLWKRLGTRVSRWPRQYRISNLVVGYGCRIPAQARCYGKPELPSTYTCSDNP